MRSLVADLARGLDVVQGYDVGSVGAGPTVDGCAVAAAVLAMPDLQAYDLMEPALAGELRAVEGREWLPSLAVCAGWRERDWPDLDGVFVTGSDSLAWVADDGRRRGDGAPALVGHSTASFADARLDTPQPALPLLLADLREILGIRTAPVWARVQRWSLSRPATARPEPFHLGESMVGLCGDGWGDPKVESAWRSGRDLGRALVARLR